MVFLAASEPLAPATITLVTSGCYNLAMTRDWEAEFKELNENERMAFRKLGEALYKISAKTPPEVVDEMEHAYAAWKNANEAIAEFIRDFRSRHKKPGQI
jgi:urease accessory protein UreF